MEDEKTKPSFTNVFTRCKEKVGLPSKASVNQLEAVVGPAMREVGITSKVHALCTSHMERSEFIQYVYCVSSHGVIPAACRLQYITHSLCMPMFYRLRRVESVPRQACRRPEYVPFEISRPDVDRDIPEAPKQGFFKSRCAPHLTPVHLAPLRALPVPRNSRSAVYVLDRGRLTQALSHAKF
jgi:hypothetical protein